MANINQTSFAADVKTLYDRNTLIRALPRLVHAGGAKRANINKYGSLEWRRFEGLGAITTPLTEGTTPAEQDQPSITQITATPAFYGAWIGYTDEIEMTAFDQFVLEVSDVLGEQAGLSVDTIVRNALTAGATKDYANGAAGRSSLDAPNDDLSYRDFVIAIATLMANNALPVEGQQFRVVIHPHTWMTLMTDPTFVNVFVEEADSGNSPIRSGYQGKFLMCNIYVSSNAREYADGGSGSTDVYSALFIGRQAFGAVSLAATEPRDVDPAGPESTNMTGQRVRPVEIIAKQLGSAGAADPVDQRATLAWKLSEDIEILDSSFVVDMEHTNGFSDA